MNNERLLRLANHLESVEEYSPESIMEVWIEWPEDNFSIWYAIKYNSSFFKYMPIWFNEWNQSELFFEPELSEEKDIGFSGSCLKFFCLTPKEFSHLFDMDGHQNVKMFGGDYLSKSSPPKSVSFNIRELIKKR